MRKVKLKLPLEGALVACRVCGRKILVERTMAGVDLSLTLDATCWDCLDAETQKKCETGYHLSAGPSAGSGQHSGRRLKETENGLVGGTKGEIGGK